MNEQANLVEATIEPARTTTTIELMGKPYQIRCQEQEVSALQKAANYLNNTMKELCPDGKLMAMEKLAVMAAINLASQLLELETKTDQNTHFLNQRLDNLQTKLEYALEPENDSLMMEISSVQA